MGKITNSPPVPPDEAPDQTPERERDVPVEEPVEREPPAEASTLGAFPEEGKDPEGTWKPEYRSALDNPRHPLHHLRNA